MAFEKRIEKLVAVGASVTANCAPCLRFHTREAQESGASAEEIAAAIAIGQSVRSGAAAKIDEAVAEVGAPPSSPGPTRGCCG